MLTGDLVAPSPEQCEGEGPCCLSGATQPDGGTHCPCHTTARDPASSLPWEGSAALCGLASYSRSTEAGDGVQKTSCLLKASRSSRAVVSGYCED